VDLPVAVAYVVPFVMVVVLTVLSLLTHRVLIAARATWLFEMPPRLAYRTPSQQAGSDATTAR
jgi:hypothetical protein